MSINAKRLKPHDRGFTLVELLITVALISLVSALALPRVREALRSNVITGAANTIDGAFSLARSTAILSGRAHGVRIERNRKGLNLQTVTTGTTSAGESLDNSGFAFANFSTRISFVQEPPPLEITEAYAFQMFVSKTTPVDKRLRYFIPRDVAPLLYAAFDTTAPGTQIAQRLVGVGSRVQIWQSRDQTRVGVITNGGLVGASFGAFLSSSTGTFPAGYGPAVLPPPPSLFGLQGVWIETGDVMLPPTFSAPNAEPAGFLDSNAELLDTLVGLRQTQKVTLQIELSPTQAATPPVNLVGKTAIDLSVSGSRTNTMMFGVQNIVERGDNLLNTPGDLLSNAASNTMNDVVVMFSPSGNVKYLLVDQTVTNGGSGRVFQWQRMPPPDTLYFLLGASDTLVQNVYDNARYPSYVTGTDYNQIDDTPTANTDPPSLQTPVPVGTSGSPLTTSRAPNIFNPEMRWIVLNSVSGHAEQVAVSEPRDPSYLLDRYGDGSTLVAPFDNAQNLTARMIDESRRLAYGDGK